MEPPTATMVICPAVSWWRRPNSGLLGAGFAGRVGMRARNLALVLVYQNLGAWRDMRSEKLAELRSAGHSLG